MNRCSVQWSFATIFLFTFLLSRVMTQMPLNFPFMDYNQAGLAAHNTKRTQHRGVTPVFLDIEAKDAALKCAKHYIQIKKIDHSCPHKKTKKYKPPLDNFGENIYFSTSKAGPVEMVNKAVNKWYDEIKYWDFKTSYVKPEYKILQGLHFTQVIWKNTQSVGMGVFTDPGFGTVVVALYGPAGNNLKQLKENVPPPYVMLR